MSLRPAHIAALPVLVAACQEPEPRVPEALAAACPIAEPARLVAAPPGFVADLDTWYGLHVFGDHILFTFDRLDDPRRAYWHLDRCTGELAPYPSLAPGLHNPYAIAAAGGRVLYANDHLGRKYLVDRLDDPGDDEAALVPGLPQETDFSAFTADSPYPFAHFSQSHGDPTLWGAAGLGGYVRTIYVHTGVDGEPARELAVDVVEFSPVRGGDFDGPFYLHHDSGELHRVDPITGAGELLLTGVRHFTRLHGLDKVIWQEIGDDQLETIWLRDLASGEDLAIAVNDFAQQSWGRDFERFGLGRVFTDRDAAVAVLPGPDGALVAAARTDTGAAVDLPPHLEFAGGSGDEFDLVLAREPELVRALWRPLTGELREWYRGPDADLTLVYRGDDRVEYFAEEPGDRGGDVWRVDLASGERERLLGPFARRPTRLDDDHYLVTLPLRDLPGPPFDGSAYASASAYDLKLADIPAGLYTPIADDVTAYRPIAGEGVVYLAPGGAEPGVWVHPFPRP